jgi:transcriptional regulator with XRE-family HTH domain
MLVAEQIGKIREEQRLAQAVVAHKIGIIQSSYGQIERQAGNSTYNVLCKVANTLDVSLLFLLDIDNKNHREENTYYKPQKHL